MPGPSGAVRSRTLLRRAPLRLLSEPSWSAVIVGVSALLVASLTAPGWFVRAAEDAALSLDRESLEADAFGSQSANLRVSWLGVVPAGVAPQFVAAMRDLPGYGDPVVTGAGSGPQALERPLVSAHGRSEVATLWTRDGAVEALAADTAVNPGPGVWLPASIAERLAVGPGDLVRLSITPYVYSTPPRASRGQPGVTVPVAGVFDPVPGSGLPTALAGAGIDPLAYPWYPGRLTGEGSALAVTDPTSFRRWTRRLQDRPHYVADMKLQSGLSPAQLGSAVRAVKELTRRLYDPGDSLRSGLNQAAPDEITPQVITAAASILTGAQQTAAQARVQVTPFVRATQALAVGLLLVALILLASRRSVEHAALTRMGVRPGERALTAAMEVLPHALLAAPLGVALALLDVRRYGPPGRPFADETVPETVAWAALAVSGVLTLTAVVGLAVGWRDERALGNRGGRVASARGSWWQPAVVVASGILAAAVLTSDLETRAEGPLTLLFPIAVSLAVAVVMGWMWSLAGHRLPRWPLRDGSAGWLARARSAATTRVPVTLALTVGLAVLGYGLAVSRGVADSVNDKAAALAGAATTVGLGQQLQGRPFSELADVGGAGSTVVYRRPVSLPPEFGDRPLLVVDPVPFEAVADWGATLDSSARTALRALARARIATRTPVILVGHTFLEPGDAAEMSLPPSGLVPIEVVAVVDTFPGTSEGDPELTVVTTRAGLFRLLPKTIDPRRNPKKMVGGEFSAWLWSRRSPHEVRTALEAQALVGEDVRLLAQVRSRSELLASEWAVGYLRPLEAGSVALVLAATVVLARRLLDRDAVADLLLRRMGWSRGELLRSRTREVLGILAGGTTAAAVTVLLLLRAPTTIESVPELPPLTVPRLEPSDAIVWLGATVAAALVATAVLAWGAGRRPPEEVLRDNR